ncbi:hypothetical protein [Actinokineospora sp. UTMC 2448]|uniref:hypothetical protein n=1 Tax=Actinokineospora sp. UTMC 2448 TaxID=2268449 RepID=UPI0021645766|nr:hypothetical protein [Actinokineospora sp. UTMC 2448]UVS81675.1 hypothetical protein Actkin_05439 [Actinokineospora sp. UTMC 2448]
MTRWPVIAAAAVAAAVLAVAAVLFTADREEPVPPVTASEALAFGGVVLPPDADVLGVRGEKGVDQLYILAVAVEAADVPTMLAESGFATSLEPGRQVHMAPIDGHAPGADVASAQDRRGRVIREVLVDRTDPARPIVHWWLFTT